MIFTPTFPTKLHQDTADLAKNYFLNISNVDTVLVVNSCARGKAVPESDLDLAILVKPVTTPTEVKNMETGWQTYVAKQPTFLKYKQSSPYTHLHVDIIDGNYTPAIMEEGCGPDYFEVEIGNHIRYAAPISNAGPHFKALQKKWLPYYDETLRKERLAMTRNACIYDLNHIPLYMERGLYFQSFDRLYVAFQKFLQALFIAKRTYPIAYNKWIKEQIETWLNMAELYPKLSTIISISNIETNEINNKAKMLRELLNNLTSE